MIAATRVLDCVVEIVKAADRPLVAREICSELQRRGVSIEKANLNHILYKENDRRELVVNEQTFAWRYDRYAAKRAEDSEKRQEEIQRAIAKKAALLKIWKNIEFETVGVRRKGTEKPFFFLREDGDHYWTIGPAGNLCREESRLYSKPEALLPSEFTPEQLKKAAEEALKERHRNLIEENLRMIKVLRETELLANEVYLGPAMVRVDDVIPVSGVIFVANASGLEPCTLSLAWQTVFQPVYLVVNTLGMGIVSDTRYGVFNICVYELIKQGFLVVESEGYLNLTLNVENDRVYIGAGEHNLYLV